MRNEGRRNFLKLLTGTVSICAASVLARKKSTDKPNVLFIAVDDLNDWVGCLGGNPQTKTPNMDRLAKQSMLFTNAHCAAPSCVPSRSAILSGVSPHKSGLYNNGNGQLRSAPYTKDAVTLPQHFMANGYQTKGVGKIFHAKDANSWHEYGPNDKFIEATNEGAHIKWGILDIPKEEVIDWKRASWAIDQLEKEQQTPFFLACGFFYPHVPWQAPKEYMDKFPVDKISMPPINLDDFDDIPWSKNKMTAEKFQKSVLDSGKGIKMVQAYLACINFVDECVGRLLDALDNSPYKDNTIIVLWSDHGMHLGEKFRFDKFALWEESARSVFMISAPSKGIAPGRCGEAVNLIDMYPTLIDLCGLSPRDGLDGTSLLPQLKDPTVERTAPSITSNDQYCNSLRTKRWRYIRRTDGEELYDHDKDPQEWNNLAKNPEYADVIKELSAYIPAEQKAGNIGKKPGPKKRRPKK